MCFGAEYNDPTPTLEESGVTEPVAQGVGRGLGAITHPRLAVDGQNVVPHRAHTEHKRLGNLLVGAPACEETEHLDLASAEAIRIGRRCSHHGLIWDRSCLDKSGGERQACTEAPDCLSSRSPERSPRRC